MGTLYYGDNLDILKRYIKDDSIDLFYLDLVAYLTTMFTRLVELGRKLITT